MPNVALDFVSVEEAARRLGQTERAVLFAINRGDLPGARKINPDKATSSWLIPVSSLKAYEKKRAQPSG